MKFKNFFTRSISLILLFTILISSSNCIVTNAQVNKNLSTSQSISNNVPSAANIFAKNNYQDALSVVRSYLGDFDIQIDELNAATLGNPFVIYNTDTDTQDAIYYFPIIAQQKVIIIMNVINTTRGWSLSLSQDMVDELNDIGYANHPQNYIFYIENEKVIAEQSTNKLELLKMSLQEKGNSTKHKDFDKKSFTDKVNYIKNTMNSQFVRVDTTTSDNDGNVKDDIDGYSPSFSTNTSTSKICSLYSSQGQQNYGRCWAASIATILNYLNGTSITAANVCDRMNIGYDTGASISTAMNAMASYTTPSYTNLIYSQASFSNVKTNIGAKKPMYLSTVKTSDSNSGHAVVLYGYQTISVSDYVVLWNPGLNSGAGGTQIVYYSSTGTTFAYNNSTYKWRYTLSSV